MPSDLITLKALSCELNDTLNSGKVLKITQPEKDEIRFNIRNNFKNYNLVISSNPNACRCHLTSTKKQNPITAPNFCMLLRKYLTNSTINSINIYANDRIIQFKFENVDELKFKKTFYIYVELINRYSNIIFCNENNTILNAIRTIPIDVLQKRPIVSGIKYKTIPVQNKIPLNNTLEIEESLKNCNYEVAKYITDQLAGLGFSTTKEILVIANINANQTSLNNVEIKNIMNILEKFYNVNSTNYYNPCITTKKNSYEYFVMPYTNIDKEFTTFNSLNEAIDFCFSNIDKEVRINEKTKTLFNALKHFKKKANNKITKNKEKLIECDHKDKYKNFGELLTANIYKIKKGQKDIEVMNYFDESCPNIKVTLDPKLSAIENVNAYFKKYTKLKNAEEITKIQLQKNIAELEYANSIEEELSRIEAEDNLNDIYNELKSLKIIKGTKVNKNKREKPSKPYIYNVDGYTIMAGKNNVQNDKLTFKIANSNDIWFHIAKEHGCHTIAFRENGIIPEKVIKIALEIAGYFSKSSTLDKVAIDYTKRKNVSRKDKTHLGMVNYINYKTAIITPNKHEEYLVKN